MANDSRSIFVEVEEIEMQGDFKMIDGIEVTCTECNHKVECFGRSDRSVMRACTMLRDECPRGESNFYKKEED